MIKLDKKWSMSTIILSVFLAFTVPSTASAWTVGQLLLIAKVPGTYTATATFSPGGGFVVTSAATVSLLADGTYVQIASPVPIALDQKESGCNGVWRVDGVNGNKVRIKAYCGLYILSPNSGCVGSPDGTCKTLVKATLDIDPQGNMTGQVNSIHINPITRELYSPLISLGFSGKKMDIDDDNDILSYPNP